MQRKIFFQGLMVGAFTAVIVVGFAPAKVAALTLFGLFAVACFLAVRS